MNGSDGMARGETSVGSGALLGIPEDDLTPRVRATLAGLIGELRHLRLDLEREKERAHRLATLADQDALTPCLNRRAFLRELSRMLAFAERYRAPSSLVYLDVNDMKRINDGFGHAAGDAALWHVATALVENVRSFDVVGRLGGDEFAVVLVQVDRDCASAKARNLADAIEARAARWNGRDLQVRVAFGIHTFCRAEPVEDALHAADRAMYARKKVPTPPRAAA
ncbi:MAG: GGDEF domain-containing protein [Kiloniellales bacterium]|nr:GGDEF domain-containing protein [Kiloniellales bacterium]